MLELGAQYFKLEKAASILKLDFTIATAGSLDASAP